MVMTVWQSYSADSLGCSQMFFMYVTHALNAVEDRNFDIPTISQV